MGAVGDACGYKIMKELKFRMLKEFKDFVNEGDFVLSMGTVDDYESAIVEGGSTQVRLGVEMFKIDVAIIKD